MSSTPAIVADNLSKLYRIGAAEQRHDTLAGMFASWIRSPLSNWRRLRKLTDIDRTDQAADLIWALRQVSFEIGEGEVVGVIGRNGAGKSTLLKILSRITEPSYGRAMIYGRVSSLLEVGTGFHPELTGRENVYLNGTVLGMSKTEIDRKLDEIVAFAEVERFLDTPVKRYSSGMSVRLAFAVAAHLEPEILLVDEVLAVGDLQFQQKCLGKMGEAARSGRTVLFVSHNMAAVRELCSRAILLDEGAISAEGSVHDVVTQYVKRAVHSEARFDADPLLFVRVTEASDVIKIAAGYQFSEPVGLPCLGFVVSDQFGMPVFGTNPVLCGVNRLRTPSREGVVQVTVTTPQLLPGTYTLSVWLGDGIEDFTAHPDCVRFEVSGTGRSKSKPAGLVGPVIPECSWVFRCEAGAVELGPGPKDK